MVKLRLKRVGKRNQSYFRLVVTDHRFPRDGRFIDELGSYNPRETTWEKKFQFNGEPNPEEKEKTVNKIVDLYVKGAEPTAVVYQLLAKRGLVLKPAMRKPK